MDHAYSQANYQGPHMDSPADNLIVDTTCTHPDKWKKCYNTLGILWNNFIGISPWLKWLDCPYLFLDQRLCAHQERAEGIIADVRKQIQELNKAHEVIISTDQIKTMIDNEFRNATSSKEGSGTFIFIDWMPDSMYRTCFYKFLHGLVSYLWDLLKHCWPHTSLSFRWDVRW